MVPGSGRASPPHGAGGRARASGLTLLELAAVTGLFAVISIMAISFVSTWQQAWNSDRLEIRISVAADQALDALALYYVGEYCAHDGDFQNSFHDLITDPADFYSEVLQSHVNEVAWARLLRDLPGGDEPQNFFWSWIWRGDDRFFGYSKWLTSRHLGTGQGVTPPVISVRWFYDPLDFDGVSGPDMAERVGATWDPLAGGHMVWQRILNIRSSRRQGQMRNFLRENSSGAPVPLDERLYCL